jgi:hypothetical protein
MSERDSGKLLRTRIMNRTKILDNVPDLYYKQVSPESTDKEQNVGMEVNFHLGERPLKLEDGLALDPRLVRIVKALARHAAEADFKASIEK